MQRVYDVAEILDSSKIESMKELIAAITQSNENFQRGESAANIEDDGTEPRVVSIGTRIVVTANESQQHRIAVLLRLLAT